MQRLYKSRVRRGSAKGDNKESGHRGYTNQECTEGVEGRRQRERMQREEEEGPQREEEGENKESGCRGYTNQERADR